MLLQTGDYAALVQHVSLEETDALYASSHTPTHGQTNEHHMATMIGPTDDGYNYYINYTQYTASAQ